MGAWGEEVGLLDVACKCSRRGCVVGVRKNEKCSGCDLQSAYACSELLRLFLSLRDMPQRLVGLLKSVDIYCLGITPLRK